MSTQTTVTVPSQRPARNESEWGHHPTAPELLGDYAREVDVWRLWQNDDVNLTYPCPLCQTRVLSGLVCRQLDCVRRRLDGHYTGTSWTLTRAGA